MFGHKHFTASLSSKERMNASDWLKSQSQASNWSVSEDYNILRHQGEKFSVENYEFLVAGKYFRLDDKQFP